MNVMKTPKSVDIEITTRCNLRCIYCSHFTTAGDVEEDLPLDEWLSFFGELNRCAVMDVTLLGGEPFIRRDIREIIEGIIRNRMRFTILTNAMLVTRDMAAFLAATRRCDQIQVSLDGSMPATHEVCRGEGSFAKALIGIGYLQEHRLPVTVRVTIHRQNVRDLENVARLLLEDYAIPFISTNSASHMGLCRKNAEIVQLTAAERSLAVETLLRLVGRYGDRIGAAAGPLADGKMWLEMERLRREGAASPPGRGYLSGCGCVMTKLGVRADGVIVPCTQLSHLEMGRVNRSSLKDVWQHHSEMVRLRKRTAIPLNAFPFCEGCAYVDYCTGNCPALAYTTTGSDEHPDPESCVRRFLNEGGKLPPEDYCEHPAV